MKWRHPCLGGQFVKWDNVHEELSTPLLRVVQYSLEHPECFYLPDNTPSFQKYFPEIYKPNLTFSQLLNIIFADETANNFSSEKLEEYKLTAAKFFFRTICVQNCQPNLDANSRKIISKVMANIYLNCAYGFKVEGKIFGFKPFEKTGKTFCEFTEKTPILKETIIEMTAYSNLLINPEGIYCLMKPKDLEGKILPYNWVNLHFKYIK